MDEIRTAERYMRSRVNASEALAGWSSEDPSYTKLASMLGYADSLEMLAMFSERDCLLLEKLCSPHGYCIYRMLLAKGNKHEW